MLINEIHWSANWRYVITIEVFSSYLLWNLFSPEFLVMAARGMLFSFSSVIQLTMSLISSILECCWYHRRHPSIWPVLYMWSSWRVYTTMQSIKVRNIFKRISSITFPSIICYSNMIKTRDEHKGTQDQQGISTISILLKEEWKLKC